MPELLPTCAPLFPWLLDRCYRNLRVVRNPADPFSLHHDGQEVEIASRSTDPITDIDIMLIRRDGSPDDRWVSWCRSANYRVDLLHFATRAVVLDALASIGHARPWALGRCWSTLTDEQAARVVSAVVRAVGPDPGAPSSVLPTCILGLWHHSELNRDWRRSVCYGKPHPDLQDGPHVTGDDPKYILSEHGPGWGYGWWAARLGRETCATGRVACDAYSVGRGALLWEQITPPEKADAP